MSTTLKATMLHLPGLDHERFTFQYQGYAFRLTDSKHDQVHMQSQLHRGIFRGCSLRTSAHDDTLGQRCKAKVR